MSVEERGVVRVPPRALHETVVLWVVREHQPLAQQAGRAHTLLQPHTRAADCNGRVGQRQQTRGGLLQLQR
eukprot:CAMPEP_0173235108 /NCGR_PEP_ID=MMETSP1142-20121109/10645_1 /TAXON_ID=483371 /ORGANISM="non described non described, Strain CCMP2298" /LENGTH=70 /DNA_ID=CAMNT_0014165317 /DNA_START=229 /DNA_END=441 /DNA_ORIENTATION=+